MRIGTSGWHCRDWQGTFYPEKLGPSRWLEWYARHFNCVEVDSSLIAAPQRSHLARWEELAPRGFEFALRVPQGAARESMTMRAEELNEFLRTVSALREKLGPILFQFPHSFGPERLPELLRFLDLLPREDFRFAIEVRNRLWSRSELSRELLDRGIPLCWVDHPWMPKDTRLCGRFIYARFSGEDERLVNFQQRLHARPADLKWWAEELGGWLRRDLPVYGFFDNFFSGHAPSDARDLVELLRMKL